MNNKKTIVYNKLVRDKIPEIIELSGKACFCETLNNEQYIRMLNKKLLEEIKEYLACGELEELADVCEVIYAILAHRKIGYELFEQIRLDKREKRGGFEKRILLKEVIEK